MSKKRLSIIIVCLCLVIAIPLCFFLTQTQMPVLKKNEEGVFIPKVSTDQLQRIFKEYNYDMLHHLKDKQPVPRLFVQSVPDDFNREKYDEVRPALFFEMMLPVILKANEALLAEREKDLRLKEEFDQTGTLTQESEKELDEWVKRYDVKPSDDLATVFSALIPRVDAVTPTLLLTMAAQDSGFATSIYARKYNAIFNQRDWNGQGVIPEEKQKEGPQYRIKTFNSLYDAIISQIHYLNTNGYFENYRIARAKYRRTNNPMRGYSIAHLLINFPYKPFKYPDIIKHLILQYEITPLDFQVLDKTMPSDSQMPDETTQPDDQAADQTVQSDQVGD